MATGEDLKMALYNKQPIYFPKKELLKAREVSLDASYYHYTLRNWDTKSAVEKVMMVASGVDRTKGGVSFTVNFGERRREAMQIDPREVFRKLRNELMPLLWCGPVMMTLERSRSGILHLHGLIRTTADPKTIKGLLWNLAGHSPNLAFRNLHQVHADRCHSAVCWSLYMTKDLLKLDAAEASKRIYMSHESTRLGKEQLGVLREAAFRKLGIEAEWRGRWQQHRTYKPSLGRPAWAGHDGSSTSPASSIIH
ncbi:hypothetical protein B0E48_04755 [Rhodanobacter sp. C03]|nr:hypothetical protein B0E48_04755 [Rhodanobacter sp. C03]